MHELKEFLLRVRPHKASAPEVARGILNCNMPIRWILEAEEDLCEMQRQRNYEKRDKSYQEETSPVAMSRAVANERPICPLDTDSEWRCEPSYVNLCDIPSASCNPEKSSIIFP
ncbi:Aux/IAA-ARF-dimerization [Artemisia annua]|uniref:Aux/IAA-ARF-dimerization n=1 Tax=Artemisia annua TaxID=35608 RepID=A0A2U1MJK3_ARTAN|nr:Aux/IAA-ARF-dimerization [Artemisia annua]